MEVEEQAREFCEHFQELKSEIAKAIVGQEEVVESVLAALVIGGHVLLEGVPGLGKTYLVRTLSQALDLRFSRIQFTPDLMPADIIGTNLVMERPGGSQPERHRDDHICLRQHKAKAADRHQRFEYRQSHQSRGQGRGLRRVWTVPPPDRSDTARDDCRPARGGCGIG